MRISIVDTVGVDPDDLAKVIAAVQQQIDEDVGPFWFVTATLDPEVEPTGDAALYLVGDVAVGAGNHAHAATWPWAEVGVGSPPVGHAEWSLAFSHEILEMLVDPLGHRLVRGPDPEGGPEPVLFVEEICDPVAGVDRSYTHEGSDVVLSDFVLPAWFTPECDVDPDQRLIPTTFTATFLPERRVQSFEVAPGGFVLLEDQSGDHWTFPRDALETPRVLAHLERRRSLPGRDA